MQLLLSTVSLHHARSSVKAAFHSNAVLAHRDHATQANLPNLNMHYSAAAPPPGGTLNLFSARIDGMIRAPSEGSWQFQIKTNGAVRFFVDDHILVDSSCVPVPPELATTMGDHEDGMRCDTWSAPDKHASVTHVGRDNVTHHISAKEGGLHLRLEWLHYGGGPADLEVLWRLGTPSKSSNGGGESDSGFVSIPSTALGVNVSPAEEWRQSLQANLSRGWNTWMRESASRHIHLPSAFGFEVALWDSASNTTFERGLVDKCDGANAASCKVKPGLHAFNGSFTSFVQRTSWSRKMVPIANATITSAHDLMLEPGEAEDDAMVLLVNASSSSQTTTTTLWAILTPNFFFDCGLHKSQFFPNRDVRVVDHVPACGSITVSFPAAASAEEGGGKGRRAVVRAHAAGFGTDGFLTVANVATADAIPAELAALMAEWGRVSLAVPLSTGPLAARISGALHAKRSPPHQSIAPAWRSTSEVATTVREQSRRLVEQLDNDYPRPKYGRMRDTVEAMRTVIGWNTVWDQRVKVVTPVSRTFGVNPWIMWDWDTFFLSLMAAESNEMLAYSNVITVTRGRTIRGQVPNAECAQWTNDDRTEPYVGAMVVREHWRKFGERNLVELLYNDLLTWNAWALERRALPPMGLISVGSDIVSTPPHDGHTKQAAIWETGMDNSPMYDQVTWSANASKMLIYDVGMTSEWLGEVDALIDLAKVLNKSDDVAMLTARQADMAKAVQSTLWSASLGLYFNYQVDTKTFNTHSSPTSFYPMLSGTATPAQAVEMTKRWLTNHSGYCIGSSSHNRTDPPTPAPIPPETGGWFMSTRYSAIQSDNAICISNPTCRAGGSSAVSEVPALQWEQEQQLDTQTSHAKQDSATFASATAAASAAALRRVKASQHLECCPPNLWRDGQTNASSYEWYRPEGYILPFPSSEELRTFPDITTVKLQMFYSASNSDNFLGINASSDYVVVKGITEKTAHLGHNAAMIFATQPNTSYVPLDLFWNEHLKDYQTVGSPMTRKYLDGYVFVQRLGFVLAPPKCDSPLPGCELPHLSPCKFGLPSTPNSDAAYVDNAYWRGRVWGPLNLLVYMGLRHSKYADIPEIKAARQQLVVQSREALLVEWLPKHHVHENLNPDTGLGDDVSSSNPMYHWGALLGFLEMWEHGKF